MRLYKCSLPYMSPTKMFKMQFMFCEIINFPSQYLSASAIATSRVPSRHTRSADDIILTLIVDNSIEVWIDGASQGTHSGWQSPMTVTLPDNPGVLAFKAHNSGGPAGVLASLTNGMVTEAREWRCTTSEPSGDGRFMLKSFLIVENQQWSIVSKYAHHFHLEHFAHSILHIKVILFIYAFTFHSHHYSLYILFEVNKILHDISL